jgi:DedD protein
MALFPFRKRPDAAEASANPAELVQRARARARQRLIGAVVLLGIGIIGFPLLFETQPRPIPVDVKIDIPRKDAVPPLAMPPAATGGTRASGQVAPAAPEAAPTATAPAAPPAERPAASAAVAESASSVPAPGTSTPSGADAQRARSPSEPRPVAAAPAAAPTAAAAAPPLAPPAPASAATAAAAAKPATEARYVVQVGAFADRAAAQKTRERVEQLGLKTYTQVVETAGGPRTRVRVGPLATRDEADKAAAKLKAAGLPAAVLTL